MVQCPGLRGQPCQSGLALSRCRRPGEAVPGVRLIKAVFFDLYNTLARFHPPREQLQVQAARAFGLDLEPAAIVRGYVDADHFMTAQNAKQHIQRMAPEERLAFFAEYERLILVASGVDASRELAGKVWARVREIPSSLAPFDDSLPTLEAVKARGLSAGLISNIYQDLGDLCRRLGMAPYLDFMVSSQSAGAEKPHPKIFLAALAKAGVEPSEAIHVGDQYHGDVVGARGVGIHPILLDRDGHLARYQDVDRIRGLAEVLRFLA